MAFYWREKREGKGSYIYLHVAKPRPAEIHVAAYLLISESTLTIHVSWVSIQEAIHCFRVLQCTFVQYLQVLIAPQRTDTTQVFQIYLKCHVKVWRIVFDKSWNLAFVLCISISPHFMKHTMPFPFLLEHWFFLIFFPPLVPCSWFCCSFENALVTSS